MYSQHLLYNSRKVNLPVYAHAWRNQEIISLSCLHSYVTDSTCIEWLVRTCVRWESCCTPLPTLFPAGSSSYSPKTTSCIGLLVPASGTRRLNWSWHNLIGPSHWPDSFLDDESWPCRWIPPLVDTVKISRDLIPLSCWKWTRKCSFSCGD